MFRYIYYIHNTTYCLLVTKNGNHGPFEVKRKRNHQISTYKHVQVHTHRKRDKEKGVKQNKICILSHIKLHQMIVTQRTKEANEEE